MAFHLHTTNQSCCVVLLITTVGRCPPQEVLDREHLAMLTYERESECAPISSTSPITCALRHGTPHEIIPSLAILQFLTPDFGYCLFLSTSALLESCCLACVRQAPKTIRTVFLCRNKASTSACKLSNPKCPSYLRHFTCSIHPSPKKLFWSRTLCRIGACSSLKVLVETTPVLCSAQHDEQSVSGVSHPIF